MTDATPPQTSQDETQQQMALAALRAPIPRLYANGFVTAQTASDVALILMSNGSPSAVLNLSYISAKTLARELETAVQSFEGTTGQRVMAMGEISERMEKQKAGGETGAR